MTKYRSSQLLNVDEAAARLSVSRHTIRAWIAARRLAHVKLGRAVRIPLNEIERIVAFGLKPAKSGAESGRGGAN